MKQKIIYAYSLPNDTSRVGQLKVGDTVKQADIRIKEQIGASRAKYIKHIDTPAITYDNKTFRDYAVHKELRRLGLEQQDGEWFKCTPKDVETAITNITKKPVFTTYQPKAIQTYLFKNQIQPAIDSGYKYLNLDYAMRTGKTLLMLELAQKRNVTPVWVGKNLTSQISAVTDNKTFGLVPDLRVISLHKEDDFSDFVASIKGKAMLVVDEADDQSHSVQSREKLKLLHDKLEEADKLDLVVTMSGTRAHRGNKILASLTEDPIKDLSIYYNEVQDIDPLKSIQRKATTITFPIGEGTLGFSDSLKSKTGRETMSEAIMSLIGDNESFDLVHRDDFPITYIKIASQGLGNINKLVAVLNKADKEFRYEAINGNYTSNREAEEYVGGLKEKYKKLVLITQGMATTSFSIPEIGRTIVITDNTLSSDDVQAIHRSCTYAKGKIYAEMVILTSSVDYNNEDEIVLNFTDIFEREVLALDKNNKDEREKVYKRILNHNSIAYYLVDSSMGEVQKRIIDEDNISQLMDVQLKNMAKVATMIGTVDFQDGMFGTGQKISKAKKAKTEKGKSEDFAGNPITPKSTANKAPTKNQKKIIAEWMNAVHNIPVIANLFDITEIRNLTEEVFDLAGVNKEDFIHNINEFKDFKNSFNIRFSTVKNNITTQDLEKVLNV